MIRGCERRIYHVKNTESDVFDEAYFVLRRGYDPAASGGRRTALDEEVRRLISGESLPEYGPREGRRGLRDRFIAFAAGALISAAAVFLVLLIFR